MSGVIEIRGLEKRFLGRSGTVAALDGIDLTIEEGEFVTLFGPSGCGKSTLLRIIAGLEDASSGSAAVLGDRPRAASKRKNIAWVPQTPALLPWRDVRANAHLPNVVNRQADRAGRSARRPETPDSVLAEIGLGGFSKARPSQLSGGMRQRAAIARGFVQGSPLLLMDEPFSALDEFTRETLQTKLLDLWEKHRRTVVFVTHSAAEAVLLSDRIVVMTPRPGRIQEIVDVGLARPRDGAVLGSAEFAEKVAEVKHALSQGWSGEETR